MSIDLVSLFVRIMLYIELLVLVLMLMCSSWHESLGWKRNGCVRRDFVACLSISVWPFGFGFGGLGISVK